MHIRLATQADLPQMLQIYAPYVEQTPISFEYRVPTLEEFTYRFDAITQQFPWLVWEENGQLLGYAYGSAPFERDAFRWCAEASIYLRQSARRRGIGKKLYLALEELLRLQGYKTLYAIVTSDNHESIAFHQALGYAHLADFPDCGFKLGSWHGVTWLQKPLNFVDSPRNFPLEISSIVENTQNLEAILAKIPLS